MFWTIFGCAFFSFLAGAITVAFFGAATIGSIEEDARNNRKRYQYTYEDILREWNRGRLGEPPPIVRSETGDRRGRSAADWISEPATGSDEPV